MMLLLYYNGQGYRKNGLWCFISKKSNLKFFKYRLPDETTIIAPGISDTIFSWAKQLKKLEKVSIDYELKNHFNRLRADILYEILNTQGEYRRVFDIRNPKEVFELLTFANIISLIRRRNYGIKIKTGKVTDNDFKIEIFIDENNINKLRKLALNISNKKLNVILV